MAHASYLVEWPCLHSLEPYLEVSNLLNVMASHEAM